MAARFVPRPAETEADIEAVAGLFRAYAASLPVDLAYQGFAAELAGLPGRYAPPLGALFGVWDEAGEALGCAALRSLSDAPGLCEIKRLFVAPEGRGLGLGRDLVQAILSAARMAGHTRIVLDTLPTMSAAVSLYRQLGFVDIAPYYDTPVAGTIFLGRGLTS